MNPFNNEETAKEVVNKQIKPVELSIDHEKILEMAKRRLSAKQNLIGQLLDYLLIVVVTFMLMSLYDTDDRIIVGFMFLAFWSIRLLIRFIKFLKPSLRKGFVAYLKERKERKIELEYNRLKKMLEEHESLELS